MTRRELIRLYGGKPKVLPFMLRGHGLGFDPSSDATKRDKHKVVKPQVAYGFEVVGQTVSGETIVRLSPPERRFSPTEWECLPVRKSRLRSIETGHMMPGDSNTQPDDPDLSERDKKAAIHFTYGKLVAREMVEYFADIFEWVERGDEFYAELLADLLHRACSKFSRLCRKQPRLFQKAARRYLQWPVMMSLQPSLCDDWYAI